MVQRIWITDSSYGVSDQQSLSKGNHSLVHNSTLVCFYQIDLVAYLSSSEELLLHHLMNILRRVLIRRSSPPLSPSIKSRLRITSSASQTIKVWKSLYLIFNNYSLKTPLVIVKDLSSHLVYLNICNKYKLAVKFCEIIMEEKIPLSQEVMCFQMLDSDKIKFLGLQIKFKYFSGK